MRAGVSMRGADATARRYRYLVGTDDAAQSPFRRPYEWALGRSLDPTLLNAAAELVTGRTRFPRPRHAGRDAEPHYRCRVALAEWAPRADGAGMIFTIEADRFLHHMVRFVVGAMVDVALQPAPAVRLLSFARRDRQPGGQPARTASGPLPVAVRYPPDLYAEA